MENFCLFCPQDQLDDIEEDKKDLINREIDRFRQSYKVSIVFTLLSLHFSTIFMHQKLFLIAFHFLHRINYVFILTTFLSYATGCRYLY